MKVTLTTASLLLIVKKVWITSKLQPSIQCQKAYSRAMQSLATVKRTFKFVSKESLNILYKAYIRPHIKFCVQAWNPYYAKDIDLLEKIQHRATKLVPELCNLPYEERLKQLNLHSLYCRRQRGDLIETFKILNNYLNIESSDFFTLSPVTYTRGDDYKINYSNQDQIYLLDPIFLLTIL